MPLQLECLTRQFCLPQMKSSLVYRKLKVIIQSVNKHEHSAWSEISRQAGEGTEYLINFGLYIPNFALL